MTEFEIRDDFILRAYSLVDEKYKNYTSQEISNAVSYFEVKIKNIPEESGKTLGVSLGSLGAMHIFFMLALIRSGRNYTIFIENADNFLNQHMIAEKCYHMFLIGPWGEDVDNLHWPVPRHATFIENLLDKEMYTELFSAKIEEEAITFDKVPYNPKHEFRYEQKAYISFHFNHQPQLAYNTGRIEDSCVKAAVDSYFLSSDVVAMVRPFRHQGVATLTIYPAIFKAKKVILCFGRKDWEREATSDDVTHIHAPYEMIRDKWNIPKKLRMLTSGGYNFTKEYVEHLRSVSEIENIVDCFGTSYCPPPLAIRKLHKDSNEFSEFVWVNEFIKPVSTLFLTCDDRKTFEGEPNQLAKMEHGLVKTNDLISTGPFKFLGSHYNYVRVDDIRITDIEFNDFLYNKCRVQDYTLKFVYISGVKVPVIVLEERYREEFDKLVIEHSMEINVEYVSNRSAS